jgi:hypothetical protein
MSVSQFRNNQPAFGCSKCDEAKAILRNLKVSEKAIENYVKSVAPQKGRITDWVRSENIIWGTETHMSPLRQTHDQCAELMLRALKNCGEVIAENIKKNKKYNSI